VGREKNPIAVFPWNFIIALLKLVSYYLTLNYLTSIDTYYVSFPYTVTIIYSIILLLSLKNWGHVFFGK
jgi:hypothetical protein